MTISLKTLACGPKSGEDFTELVTMELVPFEKTTAAIPGSSVRAFKAGDTSGKVERES